MSEPIRFYKGEETRIIKEHYSEIEHSLFKGQYYKALNEIGMFLNANSGKDNNIFAFLGDRGTGKTSCMESVAQILMDIDENTNGDENIEESSQNIIAKKNFLVLDFIDPTTFNDDTNIMDVVIGTLFEEFKRYVTNNCSKPCGNKDDDYERKKHSVLVKFQEVRRCIKYIGNTKCLYEQDDDISQMSDLSSVVKLKSLIGELTDAYLKFFGKDVLVIKVDDVDLQTKYAYTMVDQIRKYFMHKNIIILMSVKLEQLSHTIELENAKNYEPLLKQKILKASDLVEMATKYLLKLIPTNRRIYLPIADVYVEKSLKYYKDKDDKKPVEWTSIKYAITSLIYEKCRFLFYHSRGVVSPIVPRNLRELRHLFSTLMEMDDYDKTNPNLDNKNQFLNYFNNNWVSNNIDIDDSKIVSDIYGIKDASLINKTVVQHLRKRFADILPNDDKSLSNEDKKDERLQFLNTILDTRNTSYNVSIADAQAVIEYVKQRIESIKDRMLLFYIETFYSLRLYQYYDEITEKYQKQIELENLTDEQKKKLAEDEEKKKIDDSIAKLEVVKDYNNYEILVGGRFINTELTKLTPVEGYAYLSRDKRQIDFKGLKKIAKSVCDKYKKTKELSADDIESLRLVEFFALCTIQTVETLQKSANDRYRTFNELYYDIKDDSQYGLAVFDLGSFFFNIVNIERAYKHFNADLFMVADAVKANTETNTETNTKGSLYNDLLNTSKTKRDKNIQPEHALLSCAAIRNFEVYSDLLREVEFDRLDRSVSKYNKDNLKTFFKKVADYAINTYDRTDKNNPYTINFSFASAICDFLTQVNETSFNEIFVIGEEIVLDDNNQNVNKKSKKKRKSIRKMFKTFDVEKIIEILPKKDPFAVNHLDRIIRSSCEGFFNQQLKALWAHEISLCKQAFGDTISIEDAIKVLRQFKDSTNL